MLDHEPDARAAAIVAGSVVTRAVARAHDAVAAAWPGSWPRALVSAPDAPLTFWSIVAVTAALVAFAGSRLGAIL